MPEGTRTAFDVLTELSHWHREMAAIDGRIDALEAQRLRLADRASGLRDAVLAVLRANPEARAVDCGAGQVLVRTGDGDVYAVLPLRNMFALHEAPDPPVETTEEDEEEGADLEEDDDEDLDEEGDDDDTGDDFEPNRSRLLDLIASGLREDARMGTSG